MEKRFSLAKALKEIEDDRKVIETKKGFWLTQQEIQKMVAERAAAKAGKKVADEK